MTHHPDWTGKTVSIDFDGVLHTYQSGWTGPEPTDPPEEGALEFIHDLQALGLRPVIVSSRASDDVGIKHIEAWLRLYGFPPLQVSHNKVQAIAYVDDRAIRYDTGSGDWDRVIADIKALAGLGARRRGKVEHQSPAQVPNSIGEHCTDDHSNGEVCPIHGWDSSVRPAVGYVYHDILRADGQVFTVMLKDTGRWANSEKRDRYQEIAVKPDTDEPEAKRPWWKP